MPDPVVAYVEFLGGDMRPIYEDDQGQYVYDGGGNVVRGVWFIPPDECDRPVIVDGKGGGGLP